MILLLTRENSTYDSATKTFWFNLDKQLESDVKHLRFQSFSFQPKTNNETELSYPHGVLACSATLAKMSLRDHVSVLKDVNHRDDSEVLMCLHKEEQNDCHCIYTLRHPLTMTIDRRGFVNKVDVYFTDMQGNRLEGDYVMATPNVNTIQAISEIDRYFDFNQRIDGNHALDRIAATAAPALNGEDVLRLYNYAGATALYADGSSIRRQDFAGSSMMGITGNGTNEIFGNNVAGGFSSYDNGSLFFAFETPASNPAAVETMAEMAKRLQMVWNTTGEIGFLDASGAITGTGFTPDLSTAYVVEVRYDVTAAGSPNNTLSLFTTFRKLTAAGTTDTLGTDITGYEISSAGGRPNKFYFGDSSTGDLTCVYGGALVFLEAPSGVHNDTHRTDIRDYITRKWQGKQVFSDATKKNATWLAEIRH